MLLFDFLIHNMDRWSENSTNVRTLGHGGGPPEPVFAPEGVRHDHQAALPMDLRDHVGKSGATNRLMQKQADHMGVVLERPLLADHDVQAIARGPSSTEWGRRGASGRAGRSVGCTSWP